MTDILHKLAAVSNLQAQDAASDLNKLADRQQEKVYEKRAVRDVQEYYDTVMSDDVVTFDELQNLHEMRSEIGATTDNFWNSDGKVNGFSSADGTSWSYDSAQVNSHGNGNNDGFSIDLREDADNPLKNSTAKKGLEAIGDNYVRAARLAHAAGFDFVDVKSCHGYLLHEFLSPLSNTRDDAYGGDRAGRMRFPLEIIETVRAAWPKERPISVRVSAVDGIEGGVELADSIAFAREARARGADVIDCSSGGLTGSATAARIPRGYGFQVPFADAIRKEADIATMAVGLILHPQQAEDVVAQGHADLVGIGREALFDPNWPLHARLALAEDGGEAFGAWPRQYGWWLERREPGLRRLDGPALPFRRG